MSASTSACERLGLTSIASASDGVDRTPVEPVSDFATLGITAFTTTRAAGTFSTVGAEPVGEVIGRWERVRSELAPVARRLATARQVHGAAVLVHAPGWCGWLRGDAADGHIAPDPGTALAITIADCVPVFIAHPAGAVALLHSGWRGTAAGIVPCAIGALARLGFAPADLHVHAGPAICGACYEVGPDVHAALGGPRPAGPAPIDLRDVIRRQALAAGVRHVSVSERCTRCDRDRFFSHRAGDLGRQIAVIAAPGARVDSPI